MTCDTAVDLVVDSLMDRLDATAARQLEEHLSSCAACAAQAASLRAIWADLGETTVPAPNPAVALRLGRELARQSPRAGPSPVLRAAVVLLALGAGTALGRWALPHRGGAAEAGAPIEGAAFLLLIRGDEPGRRLPEAQLVREYGQWAAALRGERRLLAAEKLADDGGRWVRGADSATAVSGFFVIVAADYDDAVRIARASPHVAYGGTIEVRAVDQR